MQNSGNELPKSAAMASAAGPGTSSIVERPAQARAPERAASGSASLGAAALKAALARVRNRESCSIKPRKGNTSLTRHATGPVARSYSHGAVYEWINGDGEHGPTVHRRASISGYG